MTRQGRARHDMVWQGWAELGRAEQGRTVQGIGLGGTCYRELGWVVQDRAGQVMIARDVTGQARQGREGRAEQNRTEQGRAGQGKTGQCSAVRYRAG